MTKDDEIVRTSLRLPRALYEKLEMASGGKTMHAEIISRLEDSLKADSPEAIDREMERFRILLHDFMLEVLDQLSISPDIMRDLNKQRKLSAEIIGDWRNYMGLSDTSARDEASIKIRRDRDIRSDRIIRRWEKSKRRPKEQKTTSD